MTLPKLRIGKPDDRLEREADQVADTVIGSWNDPAPDSVATSGSFVQSTPKRVQRQVCIVADERIPLEPEEAEDEMLVSEPEEEELARVPQEQPGLVQGLSAAPDSPRLGGRSGRPLPAGVREDMEIRMAADFSAVRIHTDSQAEQMSSALGAHAFAYGSDIYFNHGEFDSNSSEGKHLLAHELTHTLQQNGNIIRRLAINPVGNLATGPCGRYSRRWDFELGSGASDAGYIVQQIDFYENIVDCPRTGQCTANPNLTFWEAWPVRRNATLHERHASAGYTDQSSYPGRPSKVGYVAAVGEIKFFLKSVTGDLGTFNTAPATPNGGWSPNASGQSGSLPSTLTRPSWWNSTPTEGPGTRGAWASWRCCGNSRDFNSIHADP